MSYSPDLTASSTLAATGAAVVWQLLAAGVMILAGATLLTIASAVRHRRSTR